MSSCFCCSTTDEILSFNWTDVTDNDIIKYNVCTKEDLSRIRIPLEALYCSEMFCSTHKAYHHIVGWNDEVIW